MSRGWKLSRQSPQKDYISAKSNQTWKWQRPFKEKINYKIKCHATGKLKKIINVFVLASVCRLCYHLPDRCLRPRPRPPEVKKGTCRIWLLSKWTPLLISAVVVFQAQNRVTINITWKVAVSFKIIMTTSVTRPCFTTQYQTCRTKTDFFGLRPVLS